MNARIATRLGAPAALALTVFVSGMQIALAVSHPSAPRSVAAKAGNTTVRVSWVPPLTTGGAPVNRYDVQRAATATGPWISVAKPAGTTFAWTNTGLRNGTRYYYRLRAHNSAGWGPASAAVSATPRTVPAAPRSPSASWGDKSATVSWLVPLTDGGAAINGYRLQYSTDGVTWTNLSAGVVTQLTAGGLQNGVQYRFRVRAHNVAGWGPASSEVSATPGVPLPPTDVVGHPNPSGVQFDWTASATVTPAVTGYEVDTSSDLNVWNLHTVGPDQTYWNVDGGYGTTFYVRVRALNNVGHSPYGTASAISGTTPSAVRNLSITYYGSPFFWNSVNWSAPAGGSPVQGYHVERIVTEGPYVHVTDVTDPTYLDQGVSHTTDYWYRITPYNQIGNGPSSIVHLTTP